MKRPLPRAEILAAAKRFAAFHNTRAKSIDFQQEISPVAFLLGNCQAISYSVVENGREVVYHHEFDTPPGLAITHDGANSIILAGDWSFTKRGFEG